MRLSIFYGILLVFGAAVHAEPSLPVDEATPAPATTEAVEAEVGAVPVANQILTLRQAQEAALAGNPTLAAVGTRVEQARQRMVQAASAYLPQLSANYRRSSTELSDSTVDAIRRGAAGSILQSAAGAIFDSSGAPPVITYGQAAFGIYSGIGVYRGADEDIDTYGASLDAGFLLFDGFARSYTLKAARAGRDEAEAGQRDAQRLLLNGIAQTYYGVQLALENAGIAQADEDFNRRLLTDARAAREAGLGSLSSVLNFEVALRAAQSNLLSAREAVDNARIALAALMGLPHAYLPDTIVTEPLGDETPELMAQPEVDELLAKAEELRPDVERARRAVDRGYALAGRERGAMLPRVSAFASRAAEIQDSSSIDSDDYATTVGVQVSYDLFTGGRNWSRHKEARLAARQSEFELDQAELDAAAEVRQAWVSLREAREQLVLQRTTEEFVRKNRDLVEQEYRAGQESLTRLTQAQRDLVAAQARLALARVGLHLAWQELYAATGENIAQFGE